MRIVIEEATRAEAGAIAEALRTLWEKKLIVTSANPTKDQIQETVKGMCQELKANMAKLEAAEGAAEPTPASPPEPYRPGEPVEWLSTGEYTGWLLGEYVDKIKLHTHCISTNIDGEGKVFCVTPSHIRHLKAKDACEVGADAAPVSQTPSPPTPTPVPYEFGEPVEVEIAKDTWVKGSYGRKNTEPPCLLPHLVMVLRTSGLCWDAFSDVSVRRPTDS